MFGTGARFHRRTTEQSASKRAARWLR